MVDKARIERTLIATLRESSRPLRPEASLTRSTVHDADQAEALRHLQSVVEGLAARIEAIEGSLRRPDRASLAEEEADGHTLFVPTANGYVVVERDGPPPRPAEEVIVDGAPYRAQRYRHSPFPADPRPCVIVEARDSRVST